ncbi:MAG: hypothetical protein IT444_09830 [Phycisphaeraceae bacterium]|nr:hypothetical protein [Phycisphaeraceae bacterium]
MGYLRKHNFSPPIEVYITLWFYPKQPKSESGAENSYNLSSATARPIDRVILELDGSASKLQPAALISRDRHTPEIHEIF